MKLYSYHRSSAAYRVRIALNLKGISYDYLPVNLLAMEQKSAQYMYQNPQGLVPALDIGNGEIIAQSGAILVIVIEPDLGTAALLAVIPGVMTQTKST